MMERRFASLRGLRCQPLPHRLTPPLPARVASNPGHPADTITIGNHVKATLNLIMWVYECERCGTRFERPDLPENVYGHALMISDTGATAYIDLLESPTFDEVSEMVDTHMPTSDEWARADAMPKVFSVACDRAPDGSIYRCNRMPLCPNCGSQAMRNWQPKDPVQRVQCEVAVVTHHGWNSLSPGDKNDKVREALREIGAIG
jgi:hypothetical protein